MENIIAWSDFSEGGKKVKHILLGRIFHLHRSTINLIPPATKRSHNPYYIMVILAPKVNTTNVMYK